MIGIVTSKHRIYQDFIKNYELDEKDCKLLNGNHMIGLRFDRIILTCFYKDLPEWFLKQLPIYSKDFKQEIEKLPCTPNVCDVEV